MDSIQNIKDGEYPFYEQDHEIPGKVSLVAPINIQQGPGSGFDADTVDGIQAVTASKRGPNKLVATDEEGLLPSSILPPNITTIAITNRAGTKLYRLWVEDDGALSYDPV